MNPLLILMARTRALLVRGHPPRGVHCVPHPRIQNDRWIRNRRLLAYFAAGGKLRVAHLSQVAKTELASEY